MELSEYIEKNGGQTQFARALGVSQGLVWQWLNGKTKITPQRAQQVERITSGLVSLHTLCPDVYPKGYRPPKA